MKMAGGYVMVISVRPGERMYGRIFQITERNAENTFMKLETMREPSVRLELRAVSGGTLHDDVLMGPPKVEMSETVHGFGNRPRTTVTHAYFYDLRGTFFLIDV